MPRRIHLPVFGEVGGLPCIMCFYCYLIEPGWCQWSNDAPHGVIASSQALLHIFKTYVQCGCYSWGRGASMMKHHCNVFGCAFVACYACINRRRRRGVFGLVVTSMQVHLDVPLFYKFGAEVFDIPKETLRPSGRWKGTGFMQFYDCHACELP